MESKMIFSIVFSLFVSIYDAVGQTVNVFSIQDEGIVALGRFLAGNSNRDYNFILDSDIHTYNAYNVAHLSTQYQFTPIGTSTKIDSDGDFNGFRIIRQGKCLLECWPYKNPLRNVSYLTMKATDKSPYIQVPLDDDTFALILGTMPFDGDNISPEMLIVVVHKDKAKVVFDRPALAYSYTASPNFSIEFVEDMTWATDANGDVIAPTAEPLSSRVKHKIWREGNMLKYKSWK